MIRWAVIGVFLAGAIGAFAWWRGSVLEELPPPAAPVQVSAVAPLPVATNRDEILKSEEAWLRQKAAEAGVEFTTSTPEAVVASSSAGGESVPEVVSSTVTAVAEEAPVLPVVPSSTPVSTEDKPLSVATSTAAATSTPPAAAAATSTATSTSPSSSAAASSTTTSTPQAASNPRKFQIDGAGFCEYNTGVSSVMLSGYPLATDAAVSGSWIITWTTTQVVFVAPDWVPAGTYRATVRGVGSSGYCTASASSPLTVTVP
ncbi:MAG: hypothetical protein HYY10_00835 [Candidatus Liptonbacteria bacterium]|nr:hypothetical protein [Candidatus Liptonbacteria bacterium]